MAEIHLMHSTERGNAPYVTSVAELLHLVNGISDRWEPRWKQLKYYFRGADNAHFSLNPSLIRQPYVGHDLEDIEYQKSLTFRMLSRPLLNADFRNSWEQQFLMQHYGMPTRLLDWTESLTVALHFAIRNPDSNADGAVWMMSPSFLIEKGLGENATHLSSAHPALEPYKLREMRTDDLDAFNSLPPLPIFPDYITSRIATQSGRFTVHTFTADALDTLAMADRNQHGDACFIHKIIIKRCCKENLRRECLILGVTESSLFPDLEGLARDMRWDDLRRYRPTACKDEH